MTSFRPVPYEESRGGPRRSFVEMIFWLIAHLVGTAVIFVSFFTIGWAVSWALHALHAIHAFPEDIFRVIVRFEVWVVYADAVLCAFVLIAAAWRFALELLESRP